MMRILVTGGAGYIGSVLVPKLLARGHQVRVLDRMFWGLPHYAGEPGVELINADVRRLPESVLDGVDAVDHLAGFSNDPTSEYNPEANWQMNALATDTIARLCRSEGVRRLVFGSSCSLYDGVDAGGLHSAHQALVALGEIGPAVGCQIFQPVEQADQRGVIVGVNIRILRAAAEGAGRFAHLENSHLGAFGDGGEHSLEGCLGAAPFSRLLPAALLHD